MTRIPFKLFGLQRTGTNLMRRLLLDNYRVESVEEWTEWKHGFVGDAHRRHGGRDVRFVVCTRDPFAWMDSCYRVFQRTS